MILRHGYYANKERRREVEQFEKDSIFHMFINEKMPVKELTEFFNLTPGRIERVLFTTGNHVPYSKPTQRGIIGFVKQTAYWETEQDILESLNPVYLPEDLKGWEKDKFNSLKKSRLWKTK